MFTVCHRCHAELPPYVEGTLIYCSHCGAPQIALGEELQTQAELAAHAAGSGAGAHPRHTGPGKRAQQTRGAFRCAALAGAIAALLAVLSRLLPPLAILGFFWIIISPVVVLGLYHSRFPRAAITTGFGARLGLVTGLCVGAAVSVVNTVALVIDRRMHALGDFDSRITQLFDQLRAQAAAQPGGDPTGLSQKLLQPEFRAGWLLAFLGIAGLMMLALTTAGGAFAGFLRSRRNA